MVGFKLTTLNQPEPGDTKTPPPSRYRSLISAPVTTSVALQALPMPLPREGGQPIIAASISVVMWSYPGTMTVVSGPHPAQLR